jgi:nitroreductase
MEAVEALTTRQSTGKFEEVSPPDKILDVVLNAAICAPDHGKLRPWKFLVFRGEARNKLGDIFAMSLEKRIPDTPKAQIDQERAKPLRAPLLIGVVAKVHPENTKIPVIEQVLSAGAAAQNIMLAFHAQGFGCIWKTGAAAYDEAVKAALGLETQDQIVGFLYAGEVNTPPVKKKRPNHAEFVEYWT